MKLLKTMVVALATGTAMTIGFFACQPGAIDQPQASTSISELLALGEKLNATEEEMNRFSTAYSKLTFEELMQYRQAQQVAFFRDHGNTESVKQAMRDEMVWFRKINEEAVALFGKPTNQIDTPQQDAVFTAMDQKAGHSNARVAACPAINFNTSFSRGSGGSTNLVGRGAREVDPGGKRDCDCQLTFATTNSTFRRLRPLSASASALLNDFGGTLGGRQLTGASGGSYPVWGKLRVSLRFSGVGSIGCDVLYNRYTLSNR